MWYYQKYTTWHHNGIPLQTLCNLCTANERKAIFKLKLKAFNHKKKVKVKNDFFKKPLGNQYKMLLLMKHYLQ